MELLLDSRYNFLYTLTINDLVSINCGTRFCDYLFFCQAYNLHIYMTLDFILPFIIFYIFYIHFFSPHCLSAFIF